MKGVPGPEIGCFQLGRFEDLAAVIMPQARLLCPLLVETQGACVTNCLLQPTYTLTHNIFGFSLSNKNFIENSWHGGSLPHSGGGTTR